MRSNVLRNRPEKNNRSNGPKWGGLQPLKRHGPSKKWPRRSDACHPRLVQFRGGSKVWIESLSKSVLNEVIKNQNLKSFRVFKYFNCFKYNTMLNWIQTLRRWIGFESALIEFSSTRFTPSTVIAKRFASTHKFINIFPMRLVNYLILGSAKTLKL